jgi:hypothetical protein
VANSAIIDRTQLRNGWLQSLREFIHKARSDRRATVEPASQSGTVEAPPSRAIETKPKARFAEPALVPGTGSATPPPTVVALVVGLRGRALTDILDLLVRQREQGEALAVVVTDDDDFIPIRRRRLPFEYLPTPERCREHCPDLDWELYRLRRLFLIRRKWQPLRIMAFGDPARALLETWRGSPFETAAPGPDLHHLG